MVKSVNREVLLYVDDTPLRYFISMKMQNKCKIRVSLSMLEKEHLSKFRSSTNRKDKIIIDNT